MRVGSYNLLKILIFLFVLLATPPTVEEILDKMNYELVMSLTVEAPVSKRFVF